MDWRAKDGLRAGATAVGVAAGLLVLATTAQTPDGFVRASFGGPLTPFSTITSDVLTIGDGDTDPTELAALLEVAAPGTVAAGVPESPYRAAFEAGSTPSLTTPEVPAPALDPTTASATPPTTMAVPAAPTPRSVVDSQGRIDCAGAVSCETDPITKVTTVTYPDGVVAIVQKINDLTVVAYKTLTDYLPPSVKSILPPVPSQAPPVLAAPSPQPSANPQPEPPVEITTNSTPPAPPTPDATVAPAIDPGPPAPDVLDPSSARKPGPRVNVTRPPLDFSPGSGPDRPGTSSGPKTDFPGLGKVKEAIDSVVDAVGKAIGPGAADRPQPPGGPEQSGQDAQTQGSDPENP